METQPDLDLGCHSFHHLRPVYAIVDVVSRFWIDTLVTTEQSSTQVQLLFTTALESQHLLDREGQPIRWHNLGSGNDEGPVLVAWSDIHTESWPDRAAMVKLAG